MNSGQKQEKAYAAAGVDIALADRLLEKVKPDFAKAVRPESLGKIGAFGGFFQAGQLAGKDSVLVSSTDSVGTKVKAASLAGEYRYLGADIVNHCCNDIAVCGAEPLFFLDYFAASRLQEEVYVPLMRGLAKACQAGNIALVGGETAELPGVYREEEFDLVGTVVGCAQRNRILTGEAIRPGDALVGFGSTGLHTNGFSLARKLFFERAGLSPQDPLPGGRGSVAAALLKPHRNYALLILDLLKQLNRGRSFAQRKGNGVLGLAHITGGGIPGNLVRILPEGIGATVDGRSWKELPVFQALRSVAGDSVPDDEYYEVFNMGIGLVAVVDQASVPSVLDAAKLHRIPAWRIGSACEGTRRVTVERS